MTNERVHLHFDLSNEDQNSNYYLQSNGKKILLAKYTDDPEKLKAHKTKNMALALIPDSHSHRITHYVEDWELPTDRVTRLKVIKPAKDPNAILPDLIGIHIHIPTKTYLKTLKKIGNDAAHPLALKMLGIHQEHVHEEKAMTVNAHASQIHIAPLGAAQSIVLSHPELARMSSDADVTSEIMSKYLQEQGDFENLITYISNGGQGSTNPWYNKTYAIKIDPKTGKEVPVEPTTAKFSNGKSAVWPTDPVSGKKVIPQYDLTDEVGGAKDGGVLKVAAPVILSVLKKTKNDENFNGVLWSRGTATTSTTKTKVKPNSPPPSSFEFSSQIINTGEGVFSVKNESSNSYGLELYSSNLQFRDNTITVPVKNWPNRYLSVYIEYQKEDGTPIPWSVLKNTKEGENLVVPNGFISEAVASVFDKKSDDPSTTKLFWGDIGSGNNIFGIPFLTAETDINFQWPHDSETGEAIATNAVIYLGGLGFGDFDADVDLAGIVLTSLMNYGFTAAMIPITIGVTGPLSKKFMASEMSKPVLAMAVYLGIPSVIILIDESTKGNETAKFLLSKLANFAVGMIFGQIPELINKAYIAILEKVLALLFTGITAEEALEEVPIAGWVLKVASVAGDIASLAATTIECIKSPATYKLQVQETMNVTVTLKPDPAAGTEHQAPIWPMVADHWIIILKYPKDGKFKSGTTYLQSGPIPGDKSAPIVVEFENVPAGGQIEMVGTVYSDSNWIAGAWNSGPKSGTPISGALAYEGAITQRVVPLTPSVTYSEKQRVGFDNTQSKHIWITTRFSIDPKFKSDLDSGILSPDFHQAFASNGVILPKDNSITVTKAKTGESWNVKDNDSNTTYLCSYVQVYSPDKNTPVYNITVLNITRPAPLLPLPKTNSSDDGNNIGKLVGITLDNKAYQLGYSWKASGMSMPINNSTNPSSNTQMYTMQSISTLAQPSDLIVQSDIGFSQMPFIAYNQFGLTPLFQIKFDTYHTELNGANNKSVSNDLISIFSKRGYVIDPSTIVNVLKEDQEWRFEQQDGTVLFDLLVTKTVEDGKWVPIISVFNYIVPRNSNFYMDPRTGPNGEYHLRAVSFHDGYPGSYSFDVDFDPTQANSWGAFQIPSGSIFYKMAVHPAGAVIAIDFALDKMWVLRLPENPTLMSEAPIAIPLSGSGNLSGLIQEPVGMTIAQDGRIIILEQGNKRIQSFDIYGNAIAAFKGPFRTTFPNQFISTFDSKTISDELWMEYQQKVPAKYLRQPIFSTLDSSSVDNLDAGVVDEALQLEFERSLLELPKDIVNLKVVTNQKGALWRISNTENGQVFDVRFDQVYLSLYNGPLLQIEIVAPSHEWKLRDLANSITLDIKVDKVSTNPLQVQQLISTAQLRELQDEVTYLDIAIENKGYIYVLYFTKNGENASEYMLDIYNPDGTVLLKEPVGGVAAARLTVDQWRTLWTLNYELFLGPNNRTEPSVSGWIPSTPD